jgi:hypothetical protein
MASGKTWRISLKNRCYAKYNARGFFLPLCQKYCWIFEKPPVYQVTIIPIKVTTLFVLIGCWLFQDPLGTLLTLWRPMPFIRIRLSELSRSDPKKNLGLAKVKVAEPTKNIWEHKLILTGGCTRKIWNNFRRAWQRLLSHMIVTCSALIADDRFSKMCIQFYIFFFQKLDTQKLVATI